jgi:hypothetical protein
VTACPTFLMSTVRLTRVLVLARSDGTALYRFGYLKASESEYGAEDDLPGRPGH